jgi:RNA polymerase sigma factor (sigma-70 family)
MPKDDTTQLQAILDLAARGNDEAYDQLIGRASERLLKLTRKMLRRYPQLRRWEDSDDVFQTVAIRLQRSLHNLKPESVHQFFGLATVEIRRSLIDLIRHHFGPEGAAAKHHSDVLGESSGDGGLLQNEPADNLKPETIDAWAQFHRSVEELPVDQSEVFHLVWYGGLEQKEIADLLGISVSTVKRRFRSARLCLFDALDGESPLSEEQK